MRDARSSSRLDARDIEADISSPFPTQTQLMETLAVMKRMQFRPWIRLKRETISIKKNHSLPKTISTEESKIRISEVIKIGKRGVPLCKVVGCTKFAQGTSNKCGLCAGPHKRIA